MSNPIDWTNTTIFIDAEPISPEEAEQFEREWAFFREEEDQAGEGELTSNP